MSYVRINLFMIDLLMAEHVANLLSTRGAPTKRSEVLFSLSFQGTLAYRTGYLLSRILVIAGKSLYMIYAVMTARFRPNQSHCFVRLSNTLAFSICFAGAITLPKVII